MEVTLTSLQHQVDNQIDIRIGRIMQAEWRSKNVLPNGKRRSKWIQVPVPGEVTDLLNLRQRLYAGDSPEEISAIVTTGAIQDKFNKAQ